MKKILTTLIAIFCVLLTYAQIAIKSTPPSFNKNLSEKVEVRQLPAFDVAKMLAEDEATKGLGPFRFGKKHKVNIIPKHAGTWEKLPNGDRVWRITFTSKGAYSLNFLFSKFYMPSNAKLYAYNADRTDVRGAFTALNNKSDGMFAISPIDGETVTLEYVEPAEVRGEGLIEISHVVHAYRGLHTVAETVLKGYGQSGACNNDVACSESAGWADQIRSVVFIIENGSEACTGAMINNTAQDGTPYLLTANHCGLQVNSNWTFLFNYQSQSCNGPDGDRSQSISGGQLRARNGASDFALFELSMPPPPDYVTYYAGWNKSSDPATNSTCIHHPQGDVKKISFNDDPLYCGSGGATETPGGNFWVVSEWEDGTTEGGSSGSPLFDQNKLIVGQLQGGSASCGNMGGYDSYGKFSKSWTGGGTPPTRLSDWLGEGVDTLHGAYFIEPPLAINVETIELVGIEEFVCNSVSLRPKLNVRNIGSTDISSLDIEYSYDGGNTLDTHKWEATMPIEFYQSATIELPQTTLGMGEYDLDINIVKVNDMSDGDATDNSIKDSFEVIDGNDIKINLMPDFFAGETSYEIINQDTDQVVYSANSFQALTLNVTDLCLPEGCYAFIIYDTFGDGICCGTGINGNYELLDGNGNTIGEGGEFVAEDRVDFCLPYTFLSKFNAPEQICKGTTLQVKNTSQVANDFTWSAPGATPSSSTATNPSFSYSQMGTYTITLTASDGTNSETYARQVDVITNNEITVNLLTDDYPAETSFQITEQSTGTILYTGDNFTEESQQYVENYCLGGGCYTFTIFDSEEDGICCGDFGDGSYQLLDVDGTELATGGVFNASESVNFCVDIKVDVDDVTLDEQLTIFPNPTNGLVHITSDKDINQVEVYNMMGQQVNTTHQDNTIDLSQQATGVYLVRMTFDEGSVTRRVVVE